MAKTFIDLVQQANDAGWIVGDCFQLKSYGKWIWRIHLRDYARGSEQMIASVYAEHAALETAMASCVTQMRQRVADAASTAAARKGKPALFSNEKLLSILSEWCKTDERFGEALLRRAAEMEEV